MSKKLPVIASSIARDGSRNYVHPADVKGRFVVRRYVTYAILLLLGLVVPFLKVDGRPALFLNIPKRQFFFFGLSFTAQDFWLTFFVLSGIGFALIVVTTIWGRIWCGYSCPHTVILEGVYRRIERLIEGPRSKRLKLNAGPWTFDKIWRKTVKHIIFVTLSAFFAHVILSYFVSLPSLLTMVGRSPAENPTAFAWMLAFTGILYFNFSWFREQLCLVICPYGRLQSTLTDHDTLVIGYDEARGEPRGIGKRKDGKGKDKEGNELGACVDCGRCVQVCPTGIDIRNGLQLDCIGCSACIDACDEVMFKTKQEPGLVRYDSLNGFHGKPKHIFRKRLIFYAVLGMAGLTASTLAFSSRTSLDATVTRGGSNAFNVIDGKVSATFHIHVTNKSPAAQDIAITTEDLPAEQLTLPIQSMTLESLKERTVPAIINIPLADCKEGKIHFKVANATEEKILSVPLVCPHK